MTPFNNDDPRWTAYVLDELDGAERDEIEQILAESPEAREHVADLRQTTDLLFRELGNEPAPALLDSHRATIARQPTGSEKAPEPVIDLRSHRRRGLWIAGGMTAAAAAAVVMMLPGPTERSEMLAREAEQAPRQQRMKLDEGQRSSAGDHGKVDYLVEAEESRNSRGYYGAPVGGQNAPASASQATSSSRIIAGLDGSYGPASIPSGAHRITGNARAEGKESNPEQQTVDTVTSNGNAERAGTEAYDRVIDNPFIAVSQEPLSTFSIDVDTASYSNVRRFLTMGSRPPADAVRIEELVNYFSYDYEPPRANGDDGPFAIHVDTSKAPWNPANHLVRVAIKGREIDASKRGPANLVFLIDVSGSMNEESKLPLLRRSLAMLLETLRPDDRIAIAVYAGASGLVLPSTPVAQKNRISSALERLQAGGSTNGGAGIELAYAVAARHFVEGGVNRVILATDGDFNVGTTSRGELTRLIENKAKSGVFLTVLGFGMGNYKDAMLEELSGKGNGTYAYIDTIDEARKVLVESALSTLVTIAKDVKIQLELNPTQVESYRLIGYENRIMAARDFDDDKKDAGEIGAGHTVTALYELVPTKGAVGSTASKPDPSLKYQTARKPSEAAYSNELFTIKLRYKQPDGDKSRLIERSVDNRVIPWQRVSRDFRFAAAVAAFGMILRGSEHRGSATLELVRELATEGRGRDVHGYRGEFIDLVERAQVVP